MINEYKKLQQAFDYFNEKLFFGQLSQAYLTVQRKKSVYGYFWHDIMENKLTGESFSEIALNIDTFSRPTKDILSTLCHEQVHQYIAEQPRFKSPTKGYHCRQWAAEMNSIGLKPISLDKPGKETGMKVTHEIIKNGLFDVACDALLSTGFTIEIESVASKSAPVKQKQDNSITTLLCPICDNSVKSRKTYKVICATCDERMTSVG